MTTTAQKAAAIRARLRRDAFSPDQPRDENGRWASTGSGSVMKSKAGGLYETKRNTGTGKYSATFSHASSTRVTKIGEHATEQEARKAAEAHNAPREAKMARSGANSARVQNQVSNAMMAERERKNAAIAAAGRRAHEEAQKPRVEMEETNGWVYITEHRGPVKSVILSTPLESDVTKRMGRTPDDVRREAKRLFEHRKVLAEREAKEARKFAREARGVEHMRGVIEKGMAEGAAASRSARAAEKTREQYTSSYQRAIAESEARIAGYKARTAAAKERTAALRSATREVKAIGLEAGRYNRLVEERQALARSQGFSDFMGGRGVGRAPPSGTTGPSGRVIGRNVIRLPSGKTSKI